MIWVGYHEHGVDVCQGDTMPSGGGWVQESEAPIQFAKDVKLQAVHAEKNRARDAGFLVNGVLFDSDLPARASYAELAIAFQQDPTLTPRWKASDGVWVDMDLALFQQVYAAGRAHIETCFAWQEDREREVAEAQTVGEVSAISAVMT